MAEKEGKSINELVDIVDSNFEPSLWKIFKAKKLGATNYAKIVFFIFLMIVYIIGAILLSQIIYLMPLVINQLTTGDSVAILLAIVATFIALISFIANISNVTKFTETKSEILGRYNYEILCKKVTPKDFPLLKALIILRSKQPEFRLSQSFDPIAKSLNKGKLREILYK